MEPQVRKKRFGLWILIAMVILVAVAIFDPTQVVVGKLMGDAFFESRPTRYWARALRADPASQSDAQLRLEQGGPEAVPVLTAMLGDYSSEQDAELRWKSAEILAKLGPDASPAGPTLVEALRDSDPHVQAMSAAALPKVGVAPTVAVPLLVEMLPTDHTVVAARALSVYRGDASPALPALLKILQDTSQGVEARWNAARTIGKIGPAAVSSVPVLIGLLNDKEGTIREHCAEAIGDIGPTVGPTAVTALIPVLSDPVPRVRRDAVRSLGYIGPAAREALPEVKKMLGDPEQIVKDAAQNALKAIAPEEVEQKEKAPENAPEKAPDKEKSTPAVNSTK